MSVIKDMNTDRLLELALAEETMISDFANTLRPTPESLTAVVRKYRCCECGYRHTDGVEVTLDEPAVRGKATGWWVCDECGVETVVDVRVTAADHRYMI